METLPSSSNGEFGAAPHERPVPRISIHAFCEFPDTCAALERAGGDRRLSKAHLTVQLGGVQAAVEAFQGQVTPNLLIVETRLQGKEALEDLDRLADVCDPATKVVIVGRANDVELYRELMRRGASEYLVAPLNPLHIIEVISGLYLDPDSAPIGRVVSFIAARGGAGSSTLAHNVGWFIAEELNINTTIVDLDLPFGTAGLDFNEEPGQGVADALSAPERLDDVLLDRLLTKRGERLSLFTTPASLERDNDAPVEAYEAVIEAVRATTPCVVVDLPHAWSPWIKATLIGSDEIVVVATPDLASLRNARNLVELVKAARPNDAAPRLVLNQLGQSKRPEIPMKDFAETMGLTLAATLPFDPALFGAAANNGQMLMEIQPNALASDGIRCLAELVTGRASPPAHKSTIPFLSMLTGKKRA
jgi:pilus assembly protein CpaE